MFGVMEGNEELKQDKLEARRKKLKGRRITREMEMILS